MKIKSNEIKEQVTCKFTFDEFTKLQEMLQFAKVAWDFRSIDNVQHLEHLDSDDVDKLEVHTVMESAKAVIEFTEMYENALSYEVEDSDFSSSEGLFETIVNH